MKKKEIRVVGLDPSWTSFGIAYADGSVGRIRTLPTAQEEARLEILAGAVVGACIDADLAVIEGYSFGSKMHREKLGYLGETIRSRMRTIGTPYVDVPPTTLKKYATGSGNAAKREVQEAAHRLLGLDEKCSNDEADAAFLRQIGLHLTGQSGLLLPSDRIEVLRPLELPREIEG